MLNEPLINQLIEGLLLRPHYSLWACGTFLCSLLWGCFSHRLFRSRSCSYMHFVLTACRTRYPTEHALSVYDEERCCPLIKTFELHDVLPLFQFFVFFGNSNHFIFHQNYRESQKFMALNIYTVKIYLTEKNSCYLLSIMNVSILSYKFDKKMRSLTF